MTTPAGYSLAPNGFYYYTDGSGPYNVDTAGNATLIGSGTSSGGGGTTPPAGNPEVAKISKLISGGGVAWVSGLTLRVSAATYYIQGILYSSAQTDVVLSTADGSNPRIDSIVLNTSSVADKVTGTPATPATKPEVNPETQLEVSFAYVDTSATVVLGSAATVNIYNNDAEWTSAVTANVNAGSTSSPINGTKSILYTTPAIGNYSRFTGSADVDLSDSTNLIFTFKNTAQWASAARLNIGFYTNGGALRGNLVSFKPGDYGSSASSTAAQQIVIPLSNFAANGLAVRRIQLTIGGLAPATSFRIDDIMLQYVGTATIDDTALHYEGAWNASKLYSLNSIATYVGGLFVAIRANTNANPLTATSDWKPLHTKVIQFSCSDLTTALTAGTGKAVFRMPYAMTVTDVRASLATAQASGSIFTVDVNDSGTTIISTKLTIDNTEKTTATAATPKVISDSALADDAEITVDIDQIGDGTAKGLVVTLIGY